ncbi:hypothetical protein PHYBOEH_002552, partial [Phytophthora boehmeriae]
MRLALRLQRSPLLYKGLQCLPIYLNHSGTPRNCRSFSSASTVRRQYISLYNYTQLDKTKLPKLRRDLRSQWGDLGVVGRIYIAEEGVNGQLVVPEPAVAAFRQSFPRLLTNAKLFYGHLIEATSSKERDEERHSGNSLPPEQWHHKLKARNDKNDSSTLVLDVRNFYEHEIGRFDGATRIMVDTFRDTFDALDEILEQHEEQHGGQKPTEVMMYCTGGIRCEKVGAYLTQYKGVSNVQKLHGGIVNYMRFLKEHKKAEEETYAASGDVVKTEEEMSLFKGKNFVFDQR